MASGQPAPPAQAPDAQAGALPRVAVVMAAFNAERTILEAVRSVLEQTYASLELVVCDDASTDSTSRILEHVRDPRLSVLRNPSNLGQGRARDRAILATQAPWIAVMDADDRWVPNRLEKLMAANAGDFDTMVFDDLMLCHDTPNGMAPWRRLRGHKAFGAKSKLPRIVPVEAFVTAPRLLIKPIFPADVVREKGIRHGDRRFGEDIEYFLRLAATGVRIRYVPEPLYQYRINPGSVTANVADERAMADAIRACAMLPGFSTAARRALEAKVSSLADNEQLYQVARALRSGRVLDATMTMSRNPKLMTLLPARLLRRFAYEIHRITNAGRRRRAF